MVDIVAKTFQNLW